MKVRLTLEALADLRSIRAYTLERWGEDQEQSYLEAMWRRFSEIALVRGGERDRSD